LTSPYADEPDSGGVPWGDIASRISGDERVGNEVHEAIQLAVAHEFYGGLGAKADRCLALAKRVMADKPSIEVLKYVRLLTRCYVAGFGPECVILCRGVLENAVRDQFRRKRVPIPATEEGRSEMGVMLTWCEKSRWLSRKTATGARDVWERGSKAVHHDPDATKDVLGTIDLTLNVLGELYGLA
jgi:hypothetical protein